MTGSSPAWAALAAAARRSELSPWREPLSLASQGRGRGSEAAEDAAPGRIPSDASLSAGPRLSRGSRRQPQAGEPSGELGMGACAPRLYHAHPATEHTSRAAWESGARQLGKMGRPSGPAVSPSGCLRRSNKKTRVSPTPISLLGGQGCRAAPSASTGLVQRAGCGRRVVGEGGAGPRARVAENIRGIAGQSSLAFRPRASCSPRRACCGDSRLAVGVTFVFIVPGLEWVPFRVTWVC